MARRSRRAERMRTALVLIVLLTLPGTASAGGPAFFVRGSFSGADAAAASAVFGGLALGFSAAGETYRSGWREDPATLIVNAAPPDARVFLDGRPLGLAGELVARGLPISLGPHVVDVQAPGFRPRAWRFVADGTFPIRIDGGLEMAPKPPDVRRVPAEP